MNSDYGSAFDRKWWPIHWLVHFTASLTVDQLQQTSALRAVCVPHRLIQPLDSDESQSIEEDSSRTWKFYLGRNYWITVIYGYLRRFSFASFRAVRFRPYVPRWLCRGRFVSATVRVKCKIKLHPSIPFLAAGQRARISSSATLIDAACAQRRNGAE